MDRHQSIAQSGQAVVSGRYAGRIEAAAIVRNRQFDPVTAARKAQSDGARLCVIEDVGQRLLSHPVQGQGGIATELDRVIDPTGDTAIEARPIGVQQGLQRGHETQVGQHSRMELFDQAPLETDAIAQHLSQSQQPGGDLRLLAAGLGGQPGNVEPCCSEDRAELIVQVSGQSRPLGFPCVLQPCGEVDTGVGGHRAKACRIGGKQSGNLTRFGHGGCLYLNGPERFGPQHSVSNSGAHKEDMPVIQGQSTKKLKVVICDDHPIVRAGFRQFLSGQPDMDGVREAASGREAMDFVRTDACDVLLLDISMPGQNGVDVLRAVRLRKPDLPVLMLSSFPEQHYALQMLKLGASGYLPKDCDPADLLRAIRSVAQGRRFVSEAVGDMLANGLGGNGDEPPHAQLSDRELQVFLRLAKGESVTAIANVLNLSFKTISTYRSRVLEKLSLKSNSDVTYYAMKNGLIQ